MIITVEMLLDGAQVRRLGGPEVLVDSLRELVGGMLAQSNPHYPKRTDLDYEVNIKVSEDRTS